MTFWKCIF